MPNSRSVNFGSSKWFFLVMWYQKDGVAVDLEVEAVLKWPQLKNVTEIRSFIRLADYYRRFMEGFMKIANPMTTLTRKEHKYKWMGSCEQSF